MTVRVTWLDDAKTTILREFEGLWTWEEYYASQSEVNTMLRSVEYNVHQILDFTAAARTLPANVLTHIGHSDRNVPPNRGKSVVVLQNAFFRQMVQLLNRIFPNVTKRVVVVATRAEAVKAIPAPVVTAA
ncbi:MAG TPA: hypothetical protein VHO69_08920 [Phototrophicaceae bacterium]|nr:hypothetical protein [Phototrophicaceae bacterium]